MVVLHEHIIDRVFIFYGDFDKIVSWIKSLFSSKSVIKTEN